VTSLTLSPKALDRRRLHVLAAGAPVLALGRTTAAHAPPAGTFSIAPGQEFAANSYVPAILITMMVSPVRYIRMAAMLALAFMMSRGPAA